MAVLRRIVREGVRLAALRAWFGFADLWRNRSSLFTGGGRGREDLTFDWKKSAIERVDKLLRRHRQFHRPAGPSLAGELACAVRLPKLRVNQSLVPAFLSSSRCSSSSQPQIA